MDVFRVESQRVDARERVSSLRRLARAARDVDALRELVIEAGVLEAAIADARHDARDAHDAVDEAWRAVTLAAGRAFVAALARGAGEGAAVLRALASVDEAALPGTVEERPPEGYAHYGLFPEAYAAAARQLVAALRPARAVVVGVRSIGTSLSAVVAAALEAAGVACRSYTVRPRGHAFDRTLVLDDALAAALADDADAVAVVCDEGPGLSGSSFAACARRLEELGVARVVLLPSWDADGSSFVNEAARARWQRHRRFVVDFDARWMGASRVVDLSAGRWRAWAEVDAPAQPQHERRKLLVDGVIHKFAGFGRWGRARLAAAERLAQAGFSPRVDGLAHGFTRQRWIDARPAPPPLDRLVDYLRWRADWIVAERADVAAAAKVLHANATGLFGGEAAAPVEALALGAARHTAPAVHADARLQAHEWLATSPALKLDGTDHGDDHFHPGPTDRAWDVAGALVELVPAAARARVVDACSAADPTLPLRLPFWEAAYLAQRAAYATLASALPPPDGFAWRRLADGYRARLQRLLFEP